MSRFIFFVLIFFFFFSCSKETPKNEADKQNEHIAAHFFIDSVSGDSAGSSRKILRIKEAWNGDSGNHEWVLGDSVKKAIVLSTTAIAFMERLNLLDRIIAVENRNLIYSEEMQKLIDSLGIKEVGSGNDLDIETILILKPDIVITFGSGSSLYDDYPKLKAAGIPAILMAEWMESSPLARFEWIKVFGFLFAKEKEADSIFNETVKKYDSLASLVKTAMAENDDKKPLVLTGYPQGSEWLAGGGNSYFSKFLNDAGSKYVWENTKNMGLLTLNIETALQSALKADFWLHPSLWTTKNEILQNEPRMSMLPLWNADVKQGNPFGDLASGFANNSTGGKIFQSSKRIGKNGARDFYESAVAYPDIVLADLISIFHPELLPNWEFVYYEKLE